MADRAPACRANPVETHSAIPARKQNAPNRRNAGAARHPIPPPGRRLDFDAWCRVLTAELRRYLPDVAATTNGRDRVTWRLGEKIVTAWCDRGVYSIRTDPRWGGFHDSERHDEFTACNLARSVAAHFDASHSIADR